MTFQQDGKNSYTFLMTLHSLRRAGVSLLVAGLLAATALSGAYAKALYSYTDDKGTRIITDNYGAIPSAYRAKVTTVEQETDAAGEGERRSEFLASAKGFVVAVPGMSFQQSKIITYAGIFALVCVFAMNLSRSEIIRALALWCLVLTGICTPVLIYTADDGAAAIMKQKAAQIEKKQQDRLTQAQ